MSLAFNLTNKVYELTSEDFYTNKKEKISLFLVTFTES